MYSLIVTTKLNDVDPQALLVPTIPAGAILARSETRFTCTYDFGDDIGAADPIIDYRRFVEGARRAPPEDVGGLPASKTSSES